MSPKRSRLLHHPAPHWVYVIAILLLAFIVRLVFLTKASIWHDEGFSIMLSSLNPIEIWQRTARDVHPPFYYELLGVWMRLFGRSEVIIRSLSLFIGVATVGMVYVLFKKVRNYHTALIAALFAAVGPMLVRYSQEARMYALEALLMIVALYAVVVIIDNPRKQFGYILYFVAIMLGLYTHYFTVLVIGSFWLFGLWQWLRHRHQPSAQSILEKPWWWFANIAALVCFLPWVPSAIGQVTRGQGLGWLAATTIRAPFDLVWQLLSFTDGRSLSLVYWFGGIAAAAVLVYVWLQDSTKQRLYRLLVLYTLLPVVVVMTVSVFKPIYHERYFVFLAPVFYGLVAVAINELFHRKRSWETVAVIGTVALLLLGVRNVYAQSSHRMREVFSVVNTDYIPGDKLIAGELYTFFDSSYYNHTEQNLQLYTGFGQPNGYGESSLIYDKNIYVDNWATVPKGRVWVIGKTGDQRYFNNIPSNWQLIKTEADGYSVAKLYQVK